MTFAIKVYPNFLGANKEYLVVELNGGVNSAFPTDSEHLKDFKAEKLAEIQLFAKNVNSIEGIELLKA